MKSQSLRSKRSRGHVILESGLSLLTVLSLLIGVFDFAQFLYIHQALVERARSAARWGAINSPSNTTAVQNMVIYNSTSAGTSGYFGLTSSMVSVTTPDSGTDNARLVILIKNYPYTIYSPLIAGAYSGPNITISVPLGKS